MAVVLTLLHELHACASQLGATVEATDRVSDHDDELSDLRFWLWQLESDLRRMNLAFQGYSPFLIQEELVSVGLREPKHVTNSSRVRRPLPTLQDIQDVINGLVESTEEPKFLLAKDANAWRVFVKSGAFPSGTDTRRLLRAFLKGAHDERQLARHLATMRSYIDRYDVEYWGLLHAPPKTQRTKVRSSLSNKQVQRWQSISRDIVSASTGYEAFTLQPPANLDSTYSFLQNDLRTSSSKVWGRIMDNPVTLIACEFVSPNNVRRGQNKNVGLTDDMRSKFSKLQRLNDHERVIARSDTENSRLEMAFFVVMTLTATQLSNEIIQCVSTDHLRNIRQTEAGSEMPCLFMRASQRQSQGVRRHRFLRLGLVLAELALAQPIEMEHSTETTDQEDLAFTLTNESGSRRVQSGELLMLVRRATSKLYFCAVRCCLQDFSEDEEEVDGPANLETIERFSNDVYYPLARYYASMKSIRARSAERKRKAALNRGGLAALQNASSDPSVLIKARG